tara:strand:- start:158 stop:397 length:240 start_codon:yes stop_codon:yes gene_type:complete
VPLDWSITGLWSKWTPAAFKADTTPYHDGATHRMPEMMADLQRNAAYATDGKQIGPFASIAPTRDDVIELARVVNGAQE